LEDYLFHEGNVPEGFHQDFESSVFNHPAHLMLQANEGWHSFCVLNSKHHKISAIIHFHIKDDTARSPLKSPFGSVEFSEQIAPVVLFRFFEFVESRLKARGVQRIIIKDCPSLYRPAHSAILHTFLLNLNYSVLDAEVGAIIPVTELRFDTKLHEWERRKIRQATDAQLVVKELSLDHLGEIYLFILGCKKHKGYSLSMSLVELKQTVHVFEKNFQLFGVFSENKLAAAAIAVRVNEDILYNFYSDHAEEFDSLSPVVFLLGHMYHYCQRNRIDKFDLGTSAIDNKPNFGLLDFKIRLGGVPATKLTFQKNLS
jgi:hypothetical protein